METKRTYQIKATGRFGTIDLNLSVELSRGVSEDYDFNIQESLSALSKSLETEILRRDKDLQASLRMEEAELLNLFGVHKIFAEPITNGYLGDHPAVSSWFIVTTHIGRIQIGWRKRVINIDWSGSALTKTTDELFPDEDVTKGERFIHAWGIDKAQEYIDKLLA